MGGYGLQFDDDEQRPRFAPVSPLGPMAAQAGPVPVTPPTVAPRGIAVTPPQQLPMTPPVHTTTDRQALAPVLAPNVPRGTLQAVQPPATNAGMPTGWRRGLGALAVGLGSFKSPQLGESIEREVFEAPHERAEQQYEQQTAEQQRQQAAERQSGLDVTEKGLKEAQTSEAQAAAEEKGREPEGRVSQQFRPPVVAEGGAWVETAPNKWEFQAGPGGKAAPPGSFDEQAYNQELKANPNLTREQFIENREGRIADRQATNQQRGFTHQDQMQHEREQHQQLVAQQREQQLTSPTRSMIEMAPTVKGFVDKISKLVEEEANGLGPLKGRWNEFMTGKVGAPNPEYAKMRTDVTLLRSALLKMHVGSRGSQVMLQEFRDVLDQGKDSPENMLAALGEIGSYAEDLENRGKQQPGGGGGAAPKPAAATHRFNPQTGKIEEIK